MVAIRITESDAFKKELGFHLMILNAPVRYTGHGYYLVPNYILDTMDRAQVGYEVVEMTPEDGQRNF